MRCFRCRFVIFFCLSFLFSCSLSSSPLVSPLREKKEETKMVKTHTHTSINVSFFFKSTRVHPFASPLLGIALCCPACCRGVSTLSDPPHPHSRQPSRLGRVGGAVRVSCRSCTAVQPLTVISIRLPNPFGDASLRVRHQAERGVQSGQALYRAVGPRR